MSLPTWTPEEDASAARDWLSGLSASKIGLALGKSRCAVIGRMRRIGIVRPEAVNEINRQEGRKARAAVFGRKGGKARNANKANGFNPTTGDRKPPTPVEAIPLNEPEQLPPDVSVLHPCKWPIGEPSSPDFRACGHPASRPYRVDMATPTYCPYHASKAFAPRPPGFAKDLVQELRRHV